MLIQSGGGGRGDRGPDPLKNIKNIGFLSNTGPDSHLMAFRWRADDGPLLVLFGSSFPLSKKTFWIRA